MSRIEELEQEIAHLKKVARCPRQPGAGMGGAIQRLRHKRGLSLRQLAVKAKVSTAMLSKTERSPAPNITLRLLDRIARELDIKMSELMLAAETNS